MSAIELRVVPLSQLKSAPYHPRRVAKLTSPANRKLRASLAAFGLVEPLVWNELTGHVVGGQARLRILAELGYTEVPVSVVRLSDAREKALCVLLDNPKAQGRYDSARLTRLLSELGESPELELTGFDRRTLAALRFDPAEPKPVEEKLPTRVEVTLVVEDAKYATLAPALDKLVGEYDLAAHVRRT
jgi:ParB-like chromosome segregation protein Spo0J